MQFAQRLATAAVAVLLVVGAAVGLLPAPAHAHDWQAPGINDAQLYLSPDGYDGNGGLNTFLGIVPGDVKGRSFVANDVAHIYLCKAGEADFPNGCQPLGVAPTMPDGTFDATIAGWSETLRRTDGSQISCVGAAGGGRVQCAVVAATFAGLTTQPTAKAEHYVCFYRPENQNGCVPGPTGAQPNPPNSARGERLALSKDREFSVYADITQVSGTKFAPSATAEIFKCPALAENLHAECRRIGAAPTDSSGSFGPVPVPFDNQSPQCASYAKLQCSVVAATFNSPTDPGSTSRAEHFVCVTGTFYPCTPGDPTVPTPPTTIAPEWEPVAPMSVAREGLASAVETDGRIYALGGANLDTNQTFDATEVFDPCRAKTWSPLAPMPTARANFAATTGPDGRIYAIGGTDASGTPLATVDAYDPAANAWSPVASLALPRSDLAAATGPDGRIYAIGGAVDFEASSLVEAYNLATNKWEAAAPLLVPRANLGAAVGAEGRIYAIGGRNESSSNVIPAVEYYNAGPAGTPGTWQAPPAASNPGLPPEMAVATGPDGLIYGTGGVTDANTVAVKLSRAYDPVANVWATSPEPMLSRRTKHASATGRDGRIYAIGGTDDPFVVDNPVVTDGPIPLSSVESLKVGPDTCPRLTPPADFDGDGRSDVSVFRPANGTWYVKDGASSPWGADGDVPVPADYDGDKRIDQAIFRPATGLWAIHGSAGVDVFVTYGISTDIPIPADYDGDGRADIAIYRPEFGTWWMRWSSTGADVAITFGIAGDVPVPADYDGDGRAELGNFRDGTWFTLPSSGGAYTAVSYGAPGDVPAPGDYDGDLSIDRAVFRPSTAEWFLHHSGDGTDETFTFGAPGDVPQPGDYNGDRIADPAVFRDGAWLIETGETYQWGIGSDIPLPLPYAIRRTLQ